MPFGLCNAPSTFQRLMERIFGDQSFQSLLLYLDDVIVFSATVKQHLHRLELVLDRLRQQNLKIKLSKCCFFRPEVRYLGHVVSSAGVSTDPEKISAVAKWARPQNLQDPSLVSLVTIGGAWFIQTTIHSVICRQQNWGHWNNDGLTSSLTSIWRLSISLDVPMLMLMLCLEKLLPL